MTTMTATTTTNTTMTMTITTTTTMTTTATTTIASTTATTTTTTTTATTKLTIMTKRRASVYMVQQEISRICINSMTACLVLLTEDRSIDGLCGWLYALSPI